MVPAPVILTVVVLFSVRVWPEAMVMPVWEMLAPMLTVALVLKVAVSPLVHVAGPSQTPAVVQTVLAGYGEECCRDGWAGEEAVE
jgi:hypothetical protein